MDNEITSLDQFQADVISTGFYSELAHKKYVQNQKVAMNNDLSMTFLMRKNRLRITRKTLGEDTVARPARGEGHCVHFLLQRARVIERRIAHHRITLKFIYLRRKTKKRSARLLPPRDGYQRRNIRISRTVFPLHAGKAAIRSIPDFDGYRESPAARPGRRGARTGCPGKFHAHSVPRVRLAVKIIPVIHAEGESPGRHPLGLRPESH